MRRLSPSLGYTKVFDSERAALRGLEGWVKDLFAELVRLSDYRSGAGRTTYQQLQTATAPTPERGRAVFAPSIDQLRRAVNKLDERGLMVRDLRANENTKVLIFQVLPRTLGESVFNPNSPVNSGVGFHWENASNSPVNSPASSLGISLLNTHSSVDNASTAVDKSRQRLREQANEIRGRIGGTDGGKGQSTAADVGRAAAPGGPARADREGGEAPPGTGAAGGAVPAAGKAAAAKRVGHGGTG